MKVAILRYSSTTCKALRALRLKARCPGSTVSDAASGAKRCSAHLWFEPKCSPTTTNRALIGYMALLALGLLAFGELAIGRPLQRLADFHSEAFDTSLPCGPRSFEASFIVQQHYARDNQLLMLLAANMAESFSRQTTSNAFRSWGFDRITHLGQVDRGAYGVLAQRPEMILLALRGTRSLREAARDALIVQQDVSATTGLLGKVHSGFYRQFLAVKHQLDQLFVKGERRPIFITGHSLGGAAASLAALYLSARGFAVWSIYTSAQPNLGNHVIQAHLQAAFSERYFRLILDDDLTPQLPPPRAAAPMVARLMPAGRSSLQASLERLDYAPSESPDMVLSSAGTLSLEDPLAVAKRFWYSMAPISNTKTLRQLVVALREKTRHHAPAGYLCRWQPSAVEDLGSASTNTPK